LARALVFINVRPGSDSLVHDLEKVEGVSEAHSSKGLYDAVAMVQADSLTKLKEIVSHRIRSLESVKATLTLTLIDAPLS
jgi:DNA-binding Lrp family transcriptional regulator